MYLNRFYAEEEPEDVVERVVRYVCDIAKNNVLSCFQFFLRGIVYTYAPCWTGLSEDRVDIQFDEVQFKIDGQRTGPIKRRVESHPDTSHLVTCEIEVF